MIKNNQTGFTLIELVVLLAILAILAAVVIPKYIRLTFNAQNAATTAIAGALSATNANNYAARSISPKLGHAVSNCTDVATLLHGGLPSGYSITSLPVSLNTTTSCSLNGPSSTTASFTATGIS